MNGKFKLPFQYIVSETLQLVQLDFWICRHGDCGYPERPGFLVLYNKFINLHTLFCALILMKHS